MHNDRVAQGQRSSSDRARAHATSSRPYDEWPRSGSRCSSRGEAWAVRRDRGHAPPTGACVAAASSAFHLQRPLSVARIPLRVAIEHGAVRLRSGHVYLAFPLSIWSFLVPADIFFNIVEEKHVGNSVFGLDSIRSGQSRGRALKKRLWCRTNCGVRRLLEPLVLNGRGTSIPKRSYPDSPSARGAMLCPWNPLFNRLLAMSPNFTAL